MIIGLKEIIDIILVAILLFGTYKFMKNTGATTIFVGIMAFIIIWFLIARVFKLELMGAILNKVISVGAIGLIVIFQNEIRRFFSRLGSKKNWRFVKRFENFKKYGNFKKNDKTFPVMKVVLACRDMANSKTGALIVIARKIVLEKYIETGDIIDAKINTRLIENIFFKNSPLHDGAMIIADGMIKSAGCILPVSQNPNISRDLGLRHRSALGISELTDAFVIVVSEETGHISTAMNGQFTLNITPDQLEQQISEKIDF